MKRWKCGDCDNLADPFEVYCTEHRLARRAVVVAEHRAKDEKRWGAIRAEKMRRAAMLAQWHHDGMTYKRLATIAVISPARVGQLVRWYNQRSCIV